MSDDLQKEIDRLKAEASTQRAAIDKLTRDLAGAHDDLKEVRGEARDRRHEGKKLAELARPRSARNATNSRPKPRLIRRAFARACRTPRA